MSATILVVEDEAAIQELIAVNLELAGHRVLRAGSAEEAIRLMSQALPDLVLLDWMLPGTSGLTLARRLRRDARSRALPIIMLTARDVEQDVLDGLEAGADDYLSKPFSPRELIARIKAVLRRRAPHLTDDTVESHGMRLDPGRRVLTINGRAHAIAPGEFRLLHFLMTHPGRVFSRRQLLDQVWGDHVFVEERTVDAHIRRIRKSLGGAGEGHEQLVETVRGSGYGFAVSSGPS
ncbi:MAG: phosphate regulon transcriptional regulator PhoB [Castellaniella sp.]